MRQSGDDVLMMLAALLLQQPPALLQRPGGSRTETLSASTVSAHAGSSPRAGSSLQDEQLILQDPQGPQGSRAVVRAPHSTFDLLDPQQAQRVDPRRSLRALEGLPEVARSVEGAALRDTCAPGSPRARADAQGIHGVLAREEQLAALQRLTQHLADIARLRHREQALQASPRRSEERSSSSGVHGSRRDEAAMRPVSDVWPPRSAGPAWVPDEASSVQSYPVDTIARMHAAAAWLSAQQQAARPQRTCDEALPAGPTAGPTLYNESEEGRSKELMSPSTMTGSNSSAQHVPEQDARSAAVQTAMSVNVAVGPAAQLEDLQVQHSGSIGRQLQGGLPAGEREDSMQRESSAELEAAVQQVLAGENLVDCQGLL